MTHRFALPRHPEHQYLDLLRELVDAPARGTRNDTGTRSVFGRQMRFDLAQGFPLLTTKKLPFRVIALEIIWFLSGSTNVRWLQEQGVKIWDEWADENGDLGPVYGAQWRRWESRRFGEDIRLNTGENLGPRPMPEGRVAGTYYHDQIGAVLESLRADPCGRRHVVNAWNVGDISDMALPPCHCLFQFYVEADGRLSMQLYQRSADVFLGLGFNIASYALLLTMFAKVLGRDPGVFIWSGGDVHLYGNHVEQAQQQILRDPRPSPSLSVAQRHDMDHWILGDFKISDYEPWPHIAAEVSA